MPAKARKNDPLGVSSPNIVTDSVRVDELVTEFKRRLDYVCSHYETARQLFDEGLTFNQSLEALQQWHARPERRRPKPRLHPEVDFVAWYLARRAADAEGRSGQLTDADEEAGALDALQRLKPRRGRPRDHQLRHHVEGLMALVQETVGVSVHATRHRKDVYAPQGSDMASQMVVAFFQRIDPQITETRIANIILDARRKRRGKPMWFRTYFPGYGLTATPF